MITWRKVPFNNKAEDKRARPPLVLAKEAGLNELRGRFRIRYGKSGVFDNIYRVGRAPVITKFFGKRQGPRIMGVPAGI